MVGDDKSRQQAARGIPLRDFVGLAPSDISPACGGLAQTKKYRCSSKLGIYIFPFGGGDEIRTRGTVTRTAV